MFTLVWVVMPCRFAVGIRVLEKPAASILELDRGGRFLQKTGTHLPNYTASHRRSPKTWYSHENLKISPFITISTYIQESAWLSRYSDGLRTGRPGFDSRHGKIFPFSTASRPAVGPSQPPIQWVQRAVYPGVKRPACEADHSPPSSADVRNGGAIPPLPPYVFMAWCLIN
jgi:hypothetical protein